MALTNSCTPRLIKYSQCGRVVILKLGGAERPLRIPPIREPVVETAAKLVFGAALEADLQPEAYGYRPKHARSHQEVRSLLLEAAQV